MATHSRSPSLFLGQSWASWADGMFITEGNADEDDEKSDAKDDSDSMKLNKKDMNLFGFCPSRDEFLLAQCETCNMLVKPQALKRHVEIRHGSVLPTTTASDQTASSKVLNSELAKTLSLPVTSFGRTSSVSTGSKPPTKASLKQVSCSMRTSSKAVSGSANCKVSSSSRTFRKANTNPVVKVERIPKEDVSSVQKTEVITTSVNSSPSKAGALSSSPALVATTLAQAGRTIVSKVSSSDKSLTNGEMLKQALGGSLLSITAAPVLPSSSPVTTVALQPVALTTTTTSVTYTQSLPTAVPTTSTTANIAVVSRTSKSLHAASLSSALAATLTSAATHFRASSHPTTATTTVVGSSKNKKSPKERKFLPCKDREFDANKHCGVMIEEMGKQCTRSLTCKTHALGLRRAVPGRKKSFDDLLKEHKAAKEALLKAKAEEQASAATSVAVVSNSIVSRVPTLVTAVSSPAALAAVSAFKLGHSEISVHRDIKSVTTALLQRSVKPNRPASGAVFQKITPGGSFPAGLIIKEEPSLVNDPSSRLSQSSESQLSQSSDQEGEATQEKCDVTYLSHHPRPSAVCKFGARVAGGGCPVFSRRTDLVRAAFLSALERQLNPPPHKKLCVESKLPKEQQAPSSSKDPYEFNMVDAGLAHQRQTVSFTIGGPISNTSGLIGKPFLKHKARSFSSQSLNVSGLTVATNVSGSPAGTPPTPIAIPSLAAALLKPAKAPDTIGTGPSGLHRAAVTLPQTVTAQPLKRKRGGGGGVQAGGSSGHGAATSTIQLQGSNVGLAVATGGSTMGVDGARVSQATLLTAASSGVNSHSATAPLTAITIPSINLANAAALGLSATLPTAKQQGQGQKGGVVKDLSFVLTGIDPLVNGQYLNITGTQLAELAAAQAMSATAEDKNIKRSRLSGVKHTTNKISSTFETLRALQGSNVLAAVPQNAVLLDGGLQGTVLAPVSSLSGGGGGGSNSTFVALTSTALAASQSSSSSSSTAVTVTPNAILRAVSEAGAPQQVTLSTASFANGIIPSAGDKQHSTVGSQHQQQQRLSNSVQARSGNTATSGKTLQAAGLLQTPQGASLCSSPGLTQLTQLKPATFNLTKGGKLTMQPVSVTFPLVNTLGLSGLTSSQPHAAAAHGQPALLVTTPTSSSAAAADTGVGTGGKAEIHIQPQISSSAPSGAVS